MNKVYRTGCILFLGLQQYHSNSEKIIVNNMCHHNHYHQHEHKPMFSDRL